MQQIGFFLVAKANIFSRSGDKAWKSNKSDHAAYY